MRIFVNLLIGVFPLEGEFFGDIIGWLFHLLGGMGFLATAVSFSLEFS